VSLRFLLDTNVLSEPLRPSPDPKIMEKLVSKTRSHSSEVQLVERTAVRPDVGCIS
jgi:predicted nucleic acid-binding protein